MGIIASGALHALNHHRQRLTEDHQHARLLAEGLEALPGIRLKLEDVETNMVYFEVDDMSANDMVKKLQQKKVEMLATGPSTIRAVTSMMVNAEDIRKAVSLVEEIL